MEFVPASEEVVRRLKVEDLWRAGRRGEGTTVAVVDTGIDPESLVGEAPAKDFDFLTTGSTRDADSQHGTRVANCVRLIAPECEIVNAKAIPRRGAPNKGLVAAAILDLLDQDVDVINLSFDVTNRDCSVVWREGLLKDHPLAEFGAIVTGEYLDVSELCELCRACWMAAQQNVPVVAAAGNRWGKAARCPAQCPGTLTVEATATKAEWDYVYDSRSKLRRWWEWRFYGSVAGNYGTSFSAGYASGAMALLLDLIRARGWVEAIELISSDYRGSTIPVTEMYQRLTGQAV